MRIFYLGSRDSLKVWEQFAPVQTSIRQIDVSNFSKLLTIILSVAEQDCANVEQNKTFGIFGFVFVVFVGLREAVGTFSF